MLDNTLPLILFLTPKCLFLTQGFSPSCHGYSLVHSYGKKIHITEDQEEKVAEVLVRFTGPVMSFLLRKFTSSQKAVGYLPNIGVTIAPLGVSCHTGCYCSTLGSQLGKIVDYPPAPTALIALSRSMKASQQEGSILVGKT